jgi:LmbE family N-acetylglucosaminyl deacetylase
MKTLVVCPHLDDEAISCGGLIRGHVLQEHEIMVLAIYGRSYNYGHHDVDADNKEEIEDFYKAAAILGYVHTRALLLPEGEPQQTGYYKVLEAIEGTMEEFNPQLVIGPAHDDLNQDHRFIAELMDIACRPANLCNITRRLEFFGVDGRQRQPNFYHTMSEGTLQVKLRAVSAYRRESRKHPHPRSIENLRAQAMVCGSQCGYPYAEAYRVAFARD